MNRFTRAVALALIAGVSLGVNTAQAQNLLPERRAVIADGVDLPGGDLSTLLSTSLEACERSCLNDQACTAFTYNARNASCFPKGAPGEAIPFARALSGLIRATPEAAQTSARSRAAELPFLSPGQWSQATTQARAMGRSHLVSGFSAETLRAAAAEARARQDAAEDMRLSGAAAALTDGAEDWLAYTRASLTLADSTRTPEIRNQSLQAALNTWLRSSESPAERHAVLRQLARSFEQSGRGRDALKTLLVAQSIAPEAATATDVERLTGLYGLRITDNRVESDLAQPRFCASFSEQMIVKGFDYSPFVQLPTPGLTVEAGWDELCVAGMRHGERVTLTFREGLPAADGQTLSKSVTLTGYIRDRAPSVAFNGAGYVLPRGQAALLPVSSVNTTKLDLELYTLSDRNLLRSLQQDWFGRRLSDWDFDRFTRDAGEKIWSGEATVEQRTNEDITTRLPLDQALKDRPAGIYALRARVPGRADADEWDNPSAWAWFVVSDLGISSFSGSDGVTAVVRSLADASAKTGVSVELLNRANRVIATTTTDSEGVARFDTALTSGSGAQAPALLVVTEGEGDIAFLSLSDPEFDLSDRGVAGREAAKPIDLFVATERGAYRAGETVHATVLARSGDARAIAGLPLTARLRRPDGVEASRQRIHDEAGGFALALPLGANPARGSWRLDILADPEAPPLASKSFLVEDFLPERIDFSYQIAEGPIAFDAPLTLDLEARYLFGAVGADLSGSAEVLLRESRSHPEFPGYRFGLAGDELQTELMPLGGALQTDASGKAQLTTSLPDPGLSGHPAEAEFRVLLSEASGRPVERRETRAIAPKGALIGLKPLFDGVVPEGGEAGFQLIATQNISAEWRLERLETRYQWYNDGDWNWEPVTSRSRVSEGRVDLSASPVNIAARTDWGQYELTVQSPDGQVLSSETFYAGWYAPADTTRSPDTLELSLDQPAYRSGDTAKLRLVPRSEGVALVSILSNRLIALKSVPVVAGENLIELPVTDDWGAGVYVTASVLRPGDAGAGRQPARSLGLAHAAIAPGDRRLSASLELPAEAAPRGPLDVALKVEGVAPGETAWATIAAVDVGILNLTGTRAPDPEGHYFGQRRLGVGLRDLYGRLIDGLTGAEGQIRSGGDSESRSLRAKPPTEELVAYFEGPVQVGADGYARTSFLLPAFNGTVKVMAIAWSQSGIGQAEGDVLVRDPVVISASLPRFLQPGDESRLRLDIHHTSGPSGRMALAASARGVTLGALPDSIDLPEGGRLTLNVPLAAETEGAGEITLSLTTPDGKMLTRDLRLSVESNDPEGQRLSRIELAPGQSITLNSDLFADFRPGSGYGLVSSGSLARFDAPGLLAALDSYPWGCTEQLSSQLLPLLYFEQMAAQIGLEGAATARERIAQTIPAILQNQTSEGGFGLWRAGYDRNAWLDAYVTDVLSRARALGHAVPDLAFRSAIDNLRNQVNAAGDFEEGGEALAYALMVLAREGAAAIGDLRYYADTKADHFTTPLGLAQLAAALSLYGDQKRADALFTRASRRALNPALSSDAVWRADFGSRLRDAAGVLALALERGSTAAQTGALANMLTVRTGSRALSTQEQAWILLAANGMAGTAGTEQFSIDGRSVSGSLVQRFDPAAPITLRNDGSAAASLTLAAFGQLTPEAAAQSGNGYTITRRYYSPTGAEADPTRIAAGSRLVAVLEVTPTSRVEGRLLVTDPLPAGFEIDNPNLLQSGQIQALSWLETAGDVNHSEFREERFMAALDWRSDKPFRLAYMLRAVSPGSFHHPAASVEDMYRPTQRANSTSGRVTVSE